MRNSNVLLSIVKFGCALGIALLEYARQASLDQKPAWAISLLGTLKGIHPEATLALAISFAGSQAVQNTLQGHRHLKRTHARLLNQILGEKFGGDAQRYRITVFRKASWLEAFLVFAWRWLRYEEERWRVLPMMPLVPWGKYLLVHVRCDRGFNPTSCTMFRVFSTNQTRSESIAGLVWSNDSAIYRDVDSVESSCERFLASSWKERRRKTRPAWLREVKQYTTTWRFHGVRQLCAIKRHGRHFLGCVLWSPEGNKWGVILVDNGDYDCPFPSSDEEAQATLATYATAIGNTLPN